MRNEELRQLLSKFVDFQIIRDNFKAKKPLEFGVLHTISINKNLISGARIVKSDEDSVTEQTSRLVIGFFQIDCIAQTQARAEEMINQIYEAIIFKNRHDLIRNGYGLNSNEISIEDRTFLEGGQYVYRFGFDFEISWREIVERNRKLIKDIEYKIEEEN